MKRDLLVIAAITIIVLVAAFLLGPHLTNPEAGKPNRNQGTPLPPPENGQASVTQREPEESPVKGNARLRLTPVNAVNGAPLDYVTASVFPRLRGIYTPSMQQNTVPGPMEFVLSPGTVTVRLVRDGYQDYNSSPLNLEEGEVLDLGQLAMAPLFGVRLRAPSDNSAKRYVYRIRKIWPPPRIDLKEPRAWTFRGRPSWCSTELPPGQYEACVAGDLESPFPYLTGGKPLPDYQYPVVMNFEVTDKGLDLRAGEDEHAGTRDVRVRVRNEAGRVPRPVFVCARVRVFDGDELATVAVAITDESGEAVLKGLKSGRVTLVAGRWSCAWDTEGGVREIDVPAEGEPEQVSLNVQEYAWDGQTSWQGTGDLAVRITRRGQPVSGVQLERQRHEDGVIHREGKYIGERSGEDGVVTVRDLPVDEFRFSLSLPTLRVFRYDLRPGRGNQHAIELCPERTAELQVKIDDNREEIYWLQFESGGEPHNAIQFRDTSIREVTVHDVPWGTHQFCLSTDYYGEILIGVEVPEVEEHEWTMLVKPFKVTIDLPDNLPRSFAIYLLTEHGERSWLERLEPTEVQLRERSLELMRVFPGRHRIQLESKDALWTSGEFRVVDRELELSGWDRQSRGEVAREPSPKLSDLRFQFSPVGSQIPPWIWELEVDVRVGDETGQTREYLVTPDPGSTKVEDWFYLHPRWTWIEVPDSRAKKWKVKDLPYDESKNEYKLRLDYVAPRRQVFVVLESNEDLADHAKQVWGARTRMLSGEQRPWQQLRYHVHDDTRSAPNASYSYAASGAWLVSWQGQAGIWLPNVSLEVQQLEVDVPGFEPAVLELVAGNSGYIELKCKLTKR